VKWNNLPRNSPYWFFTRKHGNLRLTKEGIDFFANLKKTTGPHSIPRTCPYCDFVVNDERTLTIHNNQIHHKSHQQLLADICLNGNIPRCVACSIDVKFHDLEIGFNTLCRKCDRLRTIAIVSIKRKAQNKSAWNKGLTVDTSNSVRKSRDHMKASINRVGSWSKGLSLTINSDDESLKKLSKNTSEALRKYYEENGHWSTGLTKDNDVRILNRGKKISDAFKRIPLRDRYSPEGLLASQENGRRNQKIRALKQHIPVSTIVERVKSIQHRWEPCFSLDGETFKDGWTTWASSFASFKCVQCKQISQGWPSSFIGYDGEGKICSCQKPANSNAELELHEFILSLERDVITNNKSLISPWELDIIIPEKKFALEFNGLYWHCDLVKTNTVWYHENKRLLCKNIDYSLFNVYEDEWNDRRDIIKSMIRQRLGHVTQKVHARKCKLVEFNRPAKLRDWFDQNHVDGYVNSKVGYALVDGDEIVSAMLLRKPLHQRSYGDRTIEIARFASRLNTNVRGGFTKLFERTKTWCNLNDFNRILSYKDNRFGGTGSCYKHAGMQSLRTTGISWWWTNHQERVNRFMFKTTNGVNEREIAKQHGYFRIGGCSNDVYIFDI